MFPPVVATAAFVIGFVVLGLTVVLLAMRGGPRGVRESMHGQSRAGSRAWGIGLGLVLIVFGAAIPVLIASANNNDSEKRGRGGAELAASAAHGRVIFAKNCATCHTL